MIQTSPSDHNLLDLPIVELFGRWPAAARVFIRLRMACVGCTLSGLHTSREALAAHNLEHEDFLAGLSRVIEESTGEATLPGGSP